MQRSPSVYPQMQFSHLFSESLYISGFARNIFDSEGLKYKLETNDAIVFNKDTFHNSNKFHAKLPISRRPFILSFISMGTRYSEVNAQKTGGDLSVLVNQMVQKAKVRPLIWKRHD